MTSFGRYLCYLLKKSWLRTGVFTVMGILVTRIATMTGNLASVQYRDVGLAMHATVLAVVCTLIPMLELSAFKNRRNLDTLYFFPIKRSKMALAHYIGGFLQVVTVYSIPFFSAWIYLALQTNYFALGYMLPYYLLSLLVGLVMYSFFMFIFGQANTVADGVLFSFLWAFAFYAILIAVQSIVPDEIGWSKWNAVQNWGIVYASINNLTVIFQQLIQINQQGYDYIPGFVRYAEIYRELWWLFVVWGAIGIASAAGYFVFFCRKGAEKAGEISDSFLGYRLLIPLYGYCLLIFMRDLNILTAVVLAMMAVGYVIYRRSFRFSIRDYTVMGVGVLVALLAAW